MTNNSIITKADVDALKKNVGDMLKEIKRLSKAVDDISASSEKLDNSFGGSQKIIDFVQKFNEVSSESVKSFSSVAQGIERLSKAFKRLNEIGQTKAIAVQGDQDGFINNLITLVDFIKIFESIPKESTENVKIVANFLTSATKAFNGISPEGIQKLNEVGDIKLLVDFLTNFTKDISSLEELPNVGQLGKNIKSLALSVESVFEVAGVISESIVEKEGRFSKFANKFSSSSNIPKITDFINESVAIVKQLSDALKNLSGFESIQKTGGAIKGFSDGFEAITDSLPKVLTSIENFKALNKQLAPDSFGSEALKSGNRVTEGLNNLRKNILSPKAFASELGKFAADLTKQGKLFSSFGRLFKGGDKKFDLVLNPLVEFYSEFADSLKVLQEKADSIRGIDNIISSVKTLGKSVKEILDASEQVSTVVTVGLAKRIGPGLRKGKIANLFRFLGIVAVEISRLTKKIIDIKSASKLGSSIKELGVGVRAIINESESLENFATFGAASIFGPGLRGGKIANLFRFLGIISVELSNLSKNVSNIRDISGLSLAIKAVGTGTELIVDLANRIPKDLDNIFNGIDDVLDIIREFAKTFSIITKDVQNIKDTKSLSRAIQQVGEGIEQIVIFSDKLPRRNSFRGIIKRIFVGDDIARFGNLLKRISKSISDAVKETTNISNIETFGRSLKNVSIGVEKIIEFGRSIPKARFKAVLARIFRLDSLGFALRGVKRVVKVISGIKFDASSAGALKDIGSFLTVLSKEITSDKVKQLDREAIKQFSTIIQPLTTALGKLKNVPSINIGPIINALKGFSSVGKVDIDFTRVKGFGKFFDELAKGLIKLNKVKIDPKLLKEVSGILKSFTVNVNQANSSVSNLRDPSRESGGKAYASGLKQVFNEDIVIGYFRAVGEQFFNLQVELKRTGILVLKDLGQPFQALERIAGKALSAAGGKIQQFSREILDIGQQITERFNIGRIVQSAGFDAAATFDQLASQIQVFAGEAFPIEDAKEFANQIGIEYPLSANQALEAILNLSKAGQDFASIQQTLPQAANLASLDESLGLENATKILINSVNAFDQVSEGFAGTFENANLFADAISAASDASTASIGSLQLGLENTAAAANAFGLTFEETATFLAIFADNGIEGAEAGTALTSVLNSLQRPAAKETLEELGVSLFDAEGNTRDLTEILAELRTSLGSLSEEGRAAALGKIADTFGRQNLQILLANDTFDEYLENIRNVAPASERAVALLENFRGQVQQLQGSFETLLTKAFVPLLNRGFLPLVKAGRGVIDFLIKLPQPVIDTVTNIVVLVSAIGSLVGGTLIAVGALGLFGGAVFRVLGGILTFIAKTKLFAGVLFGVFGSVSVGVLALSSLIPVAILASNVITKFFRAIEEEGSDAQIAFQKVIEAGRGLVSGVIDIVTSAGSAVGNLFNETLGFDEGFEATLVRRLNSISTSIQGFFDNVIKPIRDVTTGVSTFIRILQGEQLTFSQLDQFAASIERLREVDLVQKIFGENVTTQDILNLFGFIRSTIQDVILDVASLGGGILDAITGTEGASSRIADALGSLFSRALSGLSFATGFNLTDAITEFDEGNLISGVRSILGVALNAAREYIQENSEVIVGAIINGLNAFNPLNGISIIASLLGLENVADSISFIQARLGAFLSPVRSFIEDALSGQNIKVAIFDNFGQGAFEFVQRFQIAIESINAIAQQLAGIGARLFGDIRDESSAAASSISGVSGVIARIGLSIAELPLEIIINLQNGLEAIGDAINNAARNFSEGNFIAAITDSAGIAIPIAAALAVVLKGPLIGTILRLGRTGGIAAIKFGGLITAFLLIKNAIGNLDILLVEKDPIGFLGATIRDTAIDLLGLVGASEEFQNRVSDGADVVSVAFRNFRTVVQSVTGIDLVGYFQQAFGFILLALGKFLNVFSDLWQRQINGIILAYNQIPGVANVGFVELPRFDSTGFDESFQDVKDIAIENTDELKDFFGQFGDIELTFMQGASLRTQSLDILEAARNLREGVDSLEDLGDDQFIGLFQALRSSGNLNQFLKESSGDIEEYFAIIERLRVEAPDLLRTVDFSGQFNDVIGERVREIEDEELRIEIEDVIVSLREDGIITDLALEQVIDPLVDDIENAEEGLSVDLDSQNSIDEYVESIRVAQDVLAEDPDTSFQDFVESVGESSDFTTQELEDLFEQAQLTKGEIEETDNTAQEFIDNSAGGLSFALEEEAEKAEEELEKVQESYEKAAEKIDEFTAKAAESERKDKKREAEAQQKISDIENDFRNEQSKENEKFRLDEERREEDHRKKIAEISEKAEENIEEGLQDAAISRDAKAAQRLIEARKKAKEDAKAEIDAANEEFKEESDRRLEDQRARQNESQQRFEERRADAEQRLQEIRQENQLKSEERAKELAELQIELQEKRLAADEERKANRAITEEQVKESQARVENAQATTEATVETLSVGAKFAQKIGQILGSVLPTAANGIAEQGNQVAKLFGNVSANIAETGANIQAQGFGQMYNAIIGGFGKFAPALVNGFGQMFNAIVSGFSKATSALGSGLRGLVNRARGESSGQSSNSNDRGGGIVNGIREGINNVLPSRTAQARPAGGISNGTLSLGRGLLRLNTGGEVTRSGLAEIHRGEVVLPKTSVDRLINAGRIGSSGGMSISVNVNPTININGQTSAINEKMLAEMIEESVYGNIVDAINKAQRIR